MVSGMIAKKNIIAVLIFFLWGGAGCALFFLTTRDPSPDEWVAWGAFLFSLLVVALSYIADCKIPTLKKLRISIKILGVLESVATAIAAVVYIVLLRSAAESMSSIAKSGPAKIESLFPLPLCIATFAFFFFCYIVVFLLDFFVSFAVIDDK